MDHGATKINKWTKSILSQTGCNISTPGWFYIPFKDYIKHFKITTITQNESDYEHNSLALIERKEYAVIKLTLKTNSHLYITVSQINPRLLKSKFADIPPSSSNIMICKANSSPKAKEPQLKYITGKFSHERELVWNSESSLGLGTYFIFVEIDWTKETQVFEYIVSTYSESETHLADVTDEYEKSDILNQMLTACALKSKSYSYEEFSEQDPNECKLDLRRWMSVEDSGCDYGYILYENKSPAVVLNEEINFSKLVGYSVSNLKKSNSIKVNVSPNNKELILIKRNSNEWNISLSFKTKISYDTNDLLK